jgi:hypothetical protein
MLTVRVCGPPRERRADPLSSTLWLPERQLAARLTCDHAPPPRGALSGLQQHGRAARAGLVGRAFDARHLDVGKPERAADRTLDDPAAEPIAEFERVIGARMRPDLLLAPAAQLRVIVASVGEIAGMQLQMDDRIWGTRDHVFTR